MVIHDPEVNRAGKKLASLVIVRLIIAVGGGAELAHLIGGLVG